MNLREPNRLPDLFDDWQEWRATKGEFDSLYLSGAINRNVLRLGLRKLGYDGLDLETELNDLLEKRNASLTRRRN